MSRIKFILNKKTLTKANLLIRRAKKLYLNTKFLKLVKLANANSDSKLPLDMPTKKPLKEVLLAMNSCNEECKDSAILFVNDNFHAPAYDILNSNLTDWKSEPAFIATLKTNTLKVFAYELNRIWLNLYKIHDYTSFSNGFVSSHLPMKHPFIVPGGRFTEMYYWDSYWTMEGLLICEMHKTVRMMIENFIHLIESFGFIPNGTRLYYLNRSQPPYFSQMILAYYNFIINEEHDLTKEERDEGIRFVLDVALKSLIEEYKFWMKKKSIQLKDELDKKYVLNLYKVKTNLPRPESYMEDLHTANSFDDNNEKIRVFRGKAAAAESGYDFSSRWCRVATNQETIHTCNFIPVDLNALLFKTEKIIAFLFSKKDYGYLARKYENLALKRQEAMNKFLWSAENLNWCDYDIENRKLNKNHFYISNLTPLCVDIVPPDGISAKEIIEKNLNYLTKYKNGIPVSFLQTNEQWDFPNAWAPNQHTTIMMLLKFDRNLALELAQNFFNTVYTAWLKTGLIFEKYSVVNEGELGNGGEYEIQSGFGWTNGSILSLLNIFKDELIKPVEEDLIKPEENIEKISSKENIEVISSKENIEKISSKENIEKISSKENIEVISLDEEILKQNEVAVDEIKKET